MDCRMSDVYDTEGVDIVPLVTIHDMRDACEGMSSRRKGWPKVEHSYDTDECGSVVHAVDIDPLVEIGVFGSTANDVCKVTSSSLVEPHGCL